VRAIVIAVVAGCGFSPAPIHGDLGVDASLTRGDGSVDTPPSQPFHLRVAALIDGESWLIIHGTTAHWQHFDFAAPGRWNFVTNPIALSGVNWYPTWPDVPDTENRDCHGCMSSTTELAMAVPRAPATATWTEVQTRRAQGIVQQPTAANDYELIVLISDKGVGGAADYIVDIDVTPN
jgi:hypothetical protein